MRQGQSRVFVATQRLPRVRHPRPYSRAFDRRTIAHLEPAPGDASVFVGRLRECPPTSMSLGCASPDDFAPRTAGSPSPRWPVSWGVGIGVDAAAGRGAGGGPWSRASRCSSRVGDRYYEPFEPAFAPRRRACRPKVPLAKMLGTCEIPGGETIGDADPAHRGAGGPLRGQGGCAEARRLAA
jgi:hypothetical protein